jgi:WD40 repeat protein
MSIAPNGTKQGRDRSRYRTLFIALGATTLLVLVVGVFLQGASRLNPANPGGTSASPSTTAGTTPDARRVHQSDLGYSLELADGWRRSEVLSLRAPGSGALVGHDLFTRRTPDDERANLGGETGGPAWFWALIVEVDKNRDGLVLRQWVAEGHVGFGSGQRVEDATIDGRPALNVTGGARGDVNFLVARGDDIVSIRYTLQGDPPSGATKADLDRMIASIRLAPTPVARPTPAPPAGTSTVAGIESFPVGALTGDWTFVLRLRPEGATMLAELWAVEIYGERRMLALRWEETRSFTRTVLRRQLSPDGKRIVLSTPVDPSLGAGYQLTVVELATGATRLLVQGRDQRALTPAWSPDGSRVAYVRATDGPNDSAVWVVDASGGQPRGPLANTGTVLGWSSDGGRVGYLTLDGRYALVDVASGTQLVLGTLLQGEDDAASWRQPTAPFRPQLVAAFSATATGGEQTIAVYETPSSTPQIVLREPQPADKFSYLREPRWKPSGPLLMYRRGGEVFTTGGFVSGTPPVRVPLEGRVLRAEWVASESGIDSIVYIVDGPEALSRGASVRIALESGGNGRTLFVPPAVEGTSDVTDIAAVRY